MTSSLLFRWSLRLLLVFVITVVVTQLDITNIHALINEAFQHYITPLYFTADEFWSSQELPYFTGYEMVFVVNVVLVLIFEAAVRLLVITLRQAINSVRASLAYPILLLPLLAAIFGYYFVIFVVPNHFLSEKDIFTAVGVFVCGFTLFMGIIATRDEFEFGSGSTYIRDEHAVKSKLEYQDINDCPKITIDGGNVCDASEENQYIYAKILSVAKGIKKKNVKLELLDTADIHYTVDVTNSEVYVAYTSGFLAYIGGYRALLKRTAIDIVMQSANRAGLWASLLISNQLLSFIFFASKDTEWASDVKVNVYNVDGNYRFFSHSYIGGQLNWYAILVTLAALLFAWPLLIVIICQAPIFMLHNYMQKRKAKSISESMSVPESLECETP